MRGYEDIVRGNAAAQALGIELPTGAIGTTALESKGHSSAQGGLRGHSIGSDYPFTVTRFGDRYQAYHCLHPEQSGPVVDTYSEAAAYIASQHLHA